MSQIEENDTEETAVDDVRRVREAIAAEHRGNILEHIQESNRIFEQNRERLGIKPAQLPNKLSATK